MPPGHSSPAARARSKDARLDAAALRSLESAIDENAERIVRLRREIHAAPEPSGRELATTALIARTLRHAGIEARVMKDDLGVVADIDLGATSGSFIALRAELDCVGVNDDKPQPYASTKPGLCHACGHDAHSSIVLAAATTIHDHLAPLRSMAWRHNIRLIFQSAEETATGARLMIQQGALENVAAILALHVDPTIDAGRIGIRKGPMTAACRIFQVTIRGRGGHSARPHETLDPILAATMLISQLYQLCPRSIDGRQPLSLTVGSIHSGAAANVIPDEAVVSGTLRATRSQDAEAVAKRMQAVLEGVAASTGCNLDMEISHDCPPTNNDPALVDHVVAAAADLLGPNGVQWIELPSMGGEDFAFYQEQIPGVFLRLGAALADGRPRRPLHSSLFDINEASLAIGAKLMTRAGLSLAASFAPPS